MEITANEPITRYILSKSHYRSSDMRVKPRAFEPSPKDNRTSVFRISGLSENRIWETGEARVAKPRDRTLYARADIDTAQIKSVGLRTVANEPPKNHAEITNWPTAKDEKIALAQEIAAKAKLVLNP